MHKRSVHRRDLNEQEGLDEGSFLGISLEMYIAFVIDVFLWIIHGINIQDYNVISANSVTLVLASAILSYKIRYR